MTIYLDPKDPLGDDVEPLTRSGQAKLRARAYRARQRAEDSDSKPSPTALGELDQIRARLRYIRSTANIPPKASDAMYELEVRMARVLEAIRLSQQ